MNTLHIFTSIRIILPLLTLLPLLPIHGQIFMDNNGTTAGFGDANNTDWSVAGTNWTINAAGTGPLTTWDNTSGTTTFFHTQASTAQVRLMADFAVTGLALQGGGTEVVLGRSTQSAQVITVANGGSVDIASGMTLTIGNFGVPVALQGNFIKIGEGTLRYASQATAIGAYTITLQEGTFDSWQTKATGTQFVFTGGILRLDAGNESIGSISGASGTITARTGSPSGARILTIDQTTAGVFGGTIQNSPDVARAITKTGSATLTLTGDNTYAGVTRIAQGVLEVNKLANGGSSSSIGQSANDSPNLVLGVTSGNGGTLRYIGAGDSTDRLFRVETGATVLPSIESSGTGALVFSNTAPIQGTAFNTPYAMALGGTNTDRNVLGVRLTNTGGSGTFSLTKDGLGTWILSNTNNTYTGNTTINTGILGITNTGALPGWNTNGRYTVASGAALAVGNALTDGNIATMLGTTNFVAGASIGFDTTEGNRTFNTLGNTAQGALGLVKIGENQLTLGGTNTYTGATAINAGTLLISGTGAINSTSGITINSGGTLSYSSSTGLDRNITLNSGGTFIHNGSNAYSGTLTWNGGTLAGTNFSGVSLTVGTNKTLSPGNSPGTMETASQTWTNGGNYNLQIFNFAQAPGTGFDTIAITGTLDLTGLTAGGFNINLWSLSGINPDVDGDALNFDNMASGSWLIVSTTGGISGFDENKFTINIGAFNDTSGFSNALGGGTFTISHANDNLYLDFIPIPEPTTWMLLGVGLAALVFRNRNRR